MQSGLDTAFFDIYFKRGGVISSSFLEGNITHREEVLRQCEKFILELRKRVDTMTTLNDKAKAEKELLESEAFTWGLFVKFIKADVKKDKLANDPSLIIKDQFYKRFTEIYKENKGSLPAHHQLKQDDSYIPLSQYELIRDIITNNELIFYLTYIVDWLSSTGFFDEYNVIAPLNLQHIKNNLNNGDLEPDSLFKESSGLDERSRYEHKKLMKAVFEYLRCGKIIEAYSLLINHKQTWRAATLEGGLPFHDFLSADQIKRQKSNPRDFLKTVEEDAEETCILDFMKTKEWSATLNMRKALYPDQTKSEGFSETFGNANWLLWLINCWNLSTAKDVNSYERGIYSILGCNADALKQTFREERSSYWYDNLWAELRSLTYLDIIKRYVKLYDFFEDRIPQAEVNGDDTKAILRSNENNGFRKALNEKGLVEYEIKELLKKMDTNEEFENYNRVQLKLIESKIYSVLDRKLEHWNQLFKYVANLSHSLYETSEDQSFIGHKLRFCAYFLKMVEKLGIFTEDLPNFSDKVMGYYVRYLIKGNSAGYVIPLYAQMNSDQAKITEIAAFLAGIDNHELRKQHNRELEEYAPNLLQDIIKEIFAINRRGAIQNDLETQKKRFESLRWLNLNDNQLQDAVKEGLQLIRLFLIEDNIEAAIKLKVELVDVIFTRYQTKNRGEINDQSFQNALEEKREHDRLFDAYLAFGNYKNFMSNDFVTSDFRSASSLSKSKGGNQQHNPVNDAIIKILISLFGQNKEKRNVIYNIFNLLTSPENFTRADELRQIQRLWAFRLITWLIQIYENNIELSRAEELLTNVSNPDSDCLELIDPEDKKVMIQRLATLMINDSGFIASLLIGNQSENTEMETEQQQQAFN